MSIKTLIFLMLVLVVIAGCAQKKFLLITPPIETAYIFSHTNETIELPGAEVWKNISFAQEKTALKRNIDHTHDDRTNDTFTIRKDGIYDLGFNFDVIDTSASSTDVDVAGRAIYGNSSEIPGSVFETDITKKQIEVELSHEFLAELRAGDEVVFQFIATDGDVELSTHGTFGDHPDSGSIVIKKIANILTN
ncbi:MAG TPA: hypothetical protein ENI23_15490 [bacterium]|nr:hypothetical protein [bacterium]